MNTTLAFFLGSLTGILGTVFLLSLLMAGRHKERRMLDWEEEIRVLKRIDDSLKTDQRLQDDA